MVGKNILSNSLSKKYNFLSPNSSLLNLLDVKSIEKFFANNKIDFVIHAAGIVGGIQANISNNYNSLISNSLMGINLLSVVNKYDNIRLINLGSSCIYPKNLNRKYKEDDLLEGKLEPSNEGYALAKISVLKLIVFSNKELGKSHKTIIPCNIFGKYDSFNENKSHLVPAIIKKTIDYKNKKIDKIDIWGKGDARREFMYAEDLADFILKYFNNEKIPEVINVGIGNDYSILEYYQMISEILDLNVKFNFDLNKPIGMSSKLLDVSNQELLGWKPKHSIYSGLKKTIKYYEEISSSSILVG